jgi:hypothetical protein
MSNHTNLCEGVSIHAPAWERHWAEKRFNPDFKFQSTLPRGSDMRLGSAMPFGTPACNRNVIGTDRNTINDAS